MMKKETSRNIRLGIIVLTGTIASIVALYFIGRKQHMFGSTIRISAEFYNVSGLRKGNSVRFTGIDVGTVESVEIINDTCVEVIMIIDEDIHEFIKKDAVVSIGTDGVMGNKLVNISPGRGNAGSINKDDKLSSLKSVEIDATLRTLNNTSENINLISADLRDITQRLNTGNGLLSLLEDDVLAGNVRGAVARFRITGDNTAALTGDLKQIAAQLRAGEGTAGLLLSDTLFAHALQKIIVNVRSLSDSVAIVTGNFKNLSEGLKNGKGTLGMLLADTAFVQKLDQGVNDFKIGARHFSQGMEVMTHKWPFKKNNAQKSSSGR